MDIIKVPSRIRIGNGYYDLVLDDHIGEDWSHMGIVSHTGRDRRIVLDSHLSNLEKTETLLHEILHIVEITFGLKIKENGLDCVAYTLTQFLEYLGIELDFNKENR